MATIRDIAKLSGVSQGTVSNVLNGKGIVSSEKIKLVEAAAATLGYAVNERAKFLRQGKSQILAVILPNLKFKQYVDFYLSFVSFAESKGYTCILYLSNDDPETEREMIKRARSVMAQGVAVFPSSSSMYKEYRDNGFRDFAVLFVERDQETVCNYIGFDYTKCGESLADIVTTSEFKSIALVTDNLEFSNQRQTRDAFIKALSDHHDLRIKQIHTDMLRRHLNMMKLFEEGCPEAIFITNYGFAETIRKLLKTFFRPAISKLYTVAPLFIMPEDDYIKYELNYRLMGKQGAELLIQNILHQTIDHREILENSGFREWAAPTPATVSLRKQPACINILTLDSPEALAIKYLSLIYTQSTGVPLHISVSSYDEIHEILSNMDESSIYDIIRLDVTWLSWFAGKVLYPLEEISPTVLVDHDSFVEGLSRQYFYVQNRLFALPFSPSAQVLFFRKDLFESTVLRRLYQEMYRAPLSAPSTFAEYNRIAKFFTKSINPSSPIDYGTTVTLGSTGVAGTEFLSRYFSHSHALFDDSGRLLLDSNEAFTALNELIETKQYAKEKYCAWWTNAAQEFSEGNVAMTILYSNFASDILNRNSKVVNRVGFALVPGGSPIIGGGSLGVSKYSKNPELALSFIKWICREPLASASMQLGSVSASKKAYESYEIIDTYPWLELAKNSFALSMNRRTPYADFAPFDERRFLGILGLEVKNAYNGAISPSEALKKAKHNYEKQMLEISNH